MTFRALAAVLAALLAAPAAQAYVYLNGPMPQLAVPKAAPQGSASGFTPAPRPDLDAKAPSSSGPQGPVTSFGLINRNTSRSAGSNGYAAGSDFSDELVRHGRQSTAIGSTLAPAITITSPLK
jgi:hypothetical protein